jgi:hypothetical protein
MGTLDNTEERRAMHSWSALPNEPWARSGEISEAFTRLGIGDFQQAARWVHELPYGRNTDRGDFRLILSERRGTCSTKHALLAQLAAEQSLPVLLTLGLFEMTERNTPGIGPMLRQHGLSAIPEAHCYLVYAGRRIDVTHFGIARPEDIDFLREERISPDQIGKYKMTWHRRLLREWVERHQPPLRLTWQQVWEVREDCIRALEQPRV